MRAFYENRSYNSNLPVVAFESRRMRFFAHWHEDVELIRVCEGSLLVGINNESRVLHQGELAVCSSGDIHFYDCRDQESIVRIIIFRPELVESAGGWPRSFAFSSPFLDEGNELTGRYDAAFDTVRRETEKPDGVSLMLIRSGLMSLCAMLARLAPTQPLQPDKAGRGHHRLKGMQDALSFVEGNFTEDIRLQDAAAVANMSACHFSRLFGSIAGMGFKNYVNQLRINRAEELLRDSGHSVTEVAYKCGFGSVRTFNRIYRASRGLPPSKARP